MMRHIILAVFMMSALASHSAADAGSSAQKPGFQFAPLSKTNARGGSTPVSGGSTPVHEKDSSGTGNWSLLNGHPLTDAEQNSLSAARGRFFSDE